MGRSLERWASELPEIPEEEGQEQGNGGKLRYGDWGCQGIIQNQGPGVWPLAHACTNQVVLEELPVLQKKNTFSKISQVP